MVKFIFVERNNWRTDVEFTDPPTLPVVGGFNVVAWRQIVADCTASLSYRRVFKIQIVARHLRRLLKYAVWSLKCSSKKNHLKKRLASMQSKTELINIIGVAPRHWAWNSYAVGRVSITATGCSLQSVIAQSCRWGSWSKEREKGIGGSEIAAIAR